ncbi:MAG: nucleotidyltransferase domain-containing protein [Firmicutes bacterium]|nr:nucleotidyltransferase domain-containing protein [Bacillota bacterium]
MAVDFETARNLASDYAAEVRRALQVDKAVLYGSYAKGNATEQSDVDICFFLRDFEGKNRVDVIGELLRLCRVYKGAYFEPIAFQTSEIERGNPFVNEILATGIEI